VPTVRTLHLDCARGYGGDLFLAALCDLGLDIGPLEKGFQSAGLDVRLSCPQVSVSGQSGRRLAVSAAEDASCRRLSDLLSMVRRLPWNGRLREKCDRVFRLLAEDEASAQNTAPEEVLVHASLADMVVVIGAFYGLQVLGARRVTSTPLPWSAPCASGNGHKAVPPAAALIAEQSVDEFIASPPGVVARAGTGFGPGPDAPALKVFLVEEN